MPQASDLTVPDPDSCLRGNIWGMRSSHPDDSILAISHSSPRNTSGLQVAASSKSCYRVVVAPPLTVLMYGTPAEILVSIFSWAVGDFDVSSSLSTINRQNIVLLAISGVCQRWRLVALEHGKLWGAIAFSTQDLRAIKSASLFLRRSKGAPLFVRIDGSTDPWVQDDFIGDPARSIILELSEEFHRVRACELNLPPSYIWEVWVTPAPRMEYLAVWVDDHDHIPSTFANQVQGIQTMSFSNQLKWSTRDFLCLTTAILENKNGRGQVSVNRILEPLDATPNLTHLVICGYSNLALSSDFTTRLPALRSLDIRFCDSAMLLNHLHIPGCTTFSVTSDPPTREPFTHNGLFPEGVLALSVAFDVHTEDYCIDTLGHLGVHRKVRFQDMRGTPGVRWIAATIDDVSHFTPFFSITILEVRLTVGGVPWSSWLPRLPNVTTMDLGLLDYAEVLDSLTATGSTATLASCSRLKSISFRPIDPYVKVDYAQLKFTLSLRAQRGFPLTHIAIPRHHLGALVNSDDWWELMWSPGSRLIIGTTDKANDFQRFVVVKFCCRSRGGSVANQEYGKYKGNLSEQHGEPSGA